MRRNVPPGMCPPRAAIVALAATLAVLALASLAVAAMEFEEEAVRVSKVTVDAQTVVDMAVGPEDRLYIAWQDGRPSNPQAGSSVLFTFSEPDDRGRVLQGTIKLPAAYAASERRDPAVSVGPDGMVHVVWQERERPTNGPGPYLWEVHYSRSKDGGLQWSNAIRISPPNNQDNTAPAVAALPGDRAYVAWAFDDDPGRSIGLALVEAGSRKWYREDFVTASTRWERNGQVCLAVDASDLLHAAWAAEDLDGMGVVIQSQVLYMATGGVTQDSVLPDALHIADDWLDHVNARPALALTKRHGAWVVWVQGPVATAAVDNTTRVMADRVVTGADGRDVVVAEAASSNMGLLSVDAAVSPADEVLVAISGLGVPAGPVIYTQTCSELGCFAEAVAVPGAARAALNASVTVDSLGNVFVGWDDGDDAWVVQRRNTEPGPPELVAPNAFTHAERPEFVWTFNDPDAGASQSAIEIAFSLDPLLEDVVLGGVVTGFKGRSSRYTSPDPLAEGRWYWRVRTRDQLGLWSQWSSVGDFVIDRTPPTGTMVIAAGAEFTDELVVVLTLNASDNMVGVAPDLAYQLSTDPNFPNATRRDWPPPNRQVNQELPPGEGIKVVFFRVFDASGLYFTAMDTIVYNRTPIVLLHQPVATAPMNKPLNISCEVQRGKGVTVFLYYRRADDKDFEEAEMESRGGLHWAVVPKDDVTTRGLEYYIRARSATSTASSPAVNPADEPHEVEVYETTEQFQPSIYNPTVTLVGVVVVLVLLFLVWFYRMRE